MSLSRLVEAPCANCNSLLDALVWQSINVSSDPFLKTLFLHEKINVAECENCHSVCQLHLPFFYHDLDNDFLVVSMPEDMDPEAKNREILSIKARLTNFGDDAYRAGVHFVDGFGELRAKMVELEGPPRLDLSLLSWLSSPFQWFGGLVPPGWEPAAFAAPVFKSGAPIVLKYELSNLSDRPHNVNLAQRIHSAELSASFSDIAIECYYEGEPLKSQAWLEYAQPGPDDVTELAPGANVAGEIDLCMLFPITEPGLYRVTTLYRVAANQNDFGGILEPRIVRSVTRHFVVGAAKSAGFLSMFRRKKTAAHVATGAKLLGAWWDGGMKTLETPELKQSTLSRRLYEESLKVAEALRKQTGAAHSLHVARETLETLIKENSLDAEARQRVEEMLANFDDPAIIPATEVDTPHLPGERTGIADNASQQAVTQPSMVAATIDDDDDAAAADDPAATEEPAPAASDETSADAGDPLDDKAPREESAG